MKFITYIPATLCMLLILAGCKDDSASNPTFDDDEIPAIYMDWAAEFVYSLGDVMTFEAQVSPSDHTTCRWLIDGNVVAEGLRIEHTIDTEEPFTLRFEAERNGIKNFRTAEVSIALEFVAKEYNKVVVGMLPKNGSSGQVQWDHITHLMFTSLTVENETGSLTMPEGSELRQLNTLIPLAHNNGVQVIIDISGPMNFPMLYGGYGDHSFNNVIIDPDKRKILIGEIAAFAEEYDLDGVNISMTNINNDDGGLISTDQIAVFMNELGEVLPTEVDEGRRKFYFTATVPHNYQFSQYAYLSQVERLDWVNFLPMGVTDLAPTPHAPDYLIHEHLGLFANSELGSTRAVVGIGAFGIRYDLPEGVEITWGNLDNYLSYPSYADILRMDTNAAEKDELSLGSGLFYTGREGALRKTDIALDYNAAGMLIWMMNYDTSDADKSLTQSVYNHMNP